MSGALAVGLLVVAGPAQASPRSQATARLAATERQRAEQARAEALATRDLAAAQAQAARLADAQARQAAALRAADAGVLSAASGLSAATARQAAAEQGLARARTAFAALLPVMLRLSQMPDGAVLVQPAPAEQAMQGLMIARGLAETLNRQAAALQAQLQAAEAARAATARAAAALARERATQAEREAALDRVVAQARDQVSQAEAEGRAAADKVAQAGAAARNLREAIAAMDAAQARAIAQAAHEAATATRQHREGAAQAARARQAGLTRPAGPALAKLAGQLTVPVAGTVLRAYGAAAEDGPATGITYAPVGGAVVSSPCAGRVAFAAPFRSYGQLVIVECGGGSDIVLAGLGLITVRPGHPVRPGESLGRMPEARPSLYMELRSAGRPIDPAPFLNQAAGL